MPILSAFLFLGISYFYFMEKQEIQEKPKWYWYILFVLLSIGNYIIYVADKIIMSVTPIVHPSFSLWMQNMVLDTKYPKKEDGKIIDLKQKPVSIARIIFVYSIIVLIWWMI